MTAFIKLSPRLLAATLSAATLLLPAVAHAQEVPSYASAPQAQSQDEKITGRIQSIDGVFNITVADDRGFTDSVQLRQGTIINPTGLTLAVGMSVSILGYNGGQVFYANEIDTPYTYSGPAPVPVYYGAGWWYPGFAYGYGPSFSLVFAFGGGWGNNGYCYRAPWAGHWWAGNPSWGVGFHGYQGGTYAYNSHGGYYNSSSHGGYAYNNAHGAQPGTGARPEEHQLAPNQGPQYDHAIQRYASPAGPQAGYHAPSNGGYGGYSQGNAGYHAPSNGGGYRAPAGGGGGGGYHGGGGGGGGAASHGGGGGGGGHR
jgi:hypothetical protein